MKYKASVIKDIPTKPGYWNYQLIGVYQIDGDSDVQIGEYERNYSSFGESTFYAFERDNEWYALYSRYYTASRLMKLPSCEDLGGEEPDSDGFCPVEFYVPKETVQIVKSDDPQPYLPNHDPQRWCNFEKTEYGTSYYWPDSPKWKTELAEEYKVLREKAWIENEEWHKRNPYITRYCNYGFVAGCYWGADFAWQIRFIDLADIGKMKIDDRLGWIYLPAKVSLEDAVYVDHEGEFEIALPQRFKVNGERINDD